MQDPRTPTTVRKTAASAAERARRHRLRLRDEATPNDIVFDRALRTVIIENVENEGLTPARALSLTRERLSKKFSRDGIDRVIAKFAGEVRR